MVTLSGWTGPESAGVLLAEERGYFDEAGLEVSVLTPATPTRPIRYVVEGTDDLGVSHQPQVVLAKEEGAPVVAVGSLVSEPTATLIWLKKSKIRGIADLKGKTITIPGLSFQEDLLGNVLARAGLTLADVRVKTVGYELVPSLVSGRADAIFGGSQSVEGVKLESRGLDPVIIPVSGLGAPPYEELVWIARSDFARKNPRVVRSFMSALRRGTAAATATPRAAAKEIDADVEANPELSLKELEVGVEATLPLLSGIGYMNPRTASRLVAWMHRQGMIERELPVSTLLTNRYVR